MKEENKKKNTIMVILLTVLVMIIFFGTIFFVLNSKGIISLANNPKEISEEENNSSDDEYQNDTEADNEYQNYFEKDIDKKLSETLETVENGRTDLQFVVDEMAVTLVTEAAGKVGLISNDYAYCGDNMSHDDKDAIFDEDGLSTHNASKDYNSLEEMKNDLRKYMSEEIINKYIKDDYYIEKDSKLYCLTSHKGGIFYDAENSSYNVDSVDENKIIAHGIMGRTSEHDDAYRNDVKIELKKINNSYIITKFEVKTDYVFDTYTGKY